MLYSASYPWPLLTWTVRCSDVPLLKRCVNTSHISLSSFVMLVEKTSGTSSLGVLPTVNPLGSLTPFRKQWYGWMCLLNLLTWTVNVFDKGRHKAVVESCNDGLL